MIENSGSNCREVSLETPFLTTWRTIMSEYTHTSPYKHFRLVRLGDVEIHEIIVGGSLSTDSHLKKYSTVTLQVSTYLEITAKHIKLH